MSERYGVRLLASPMLGVYDVRCSAERGGPGPDEHSGVTQVILPIEGVFEVHRGRQSVVSDAASVVILETGHDHRVGHPATGGDRSLVLVFSPAVIEDALEPADGFGGPVGSRVHLGVQALAAGLRGGCLSELEAEDLALGLLERVCIDLARTRGYRPQSRHQVERIEQVRALLAAEPERRWRLDELARAVHCSPFHLARQFRGITGTSVSAYLLRLRLGLASQRLAEGDDDLARLANDLGFASHSHFSARFRSVFGVSPGTVRQALTRGTAPELRTFMTAEGRAAP